MKKKCTKKKLTAEQKAAQLKKRKVLAFRKKIRSSFTDAGFTYFSTLDKHFPIGTRTVELDYLFLYENIIVICEDNTKQKKDIDHIRNKNESFAEIRNNKTAFLNWLSNTFPEKATMVKQYRPERYFLYYIYISQTELEITEDEKNRYSNLLFWDPETLSYFNRMAQCIQHSARYEIFRYLGLKNDEIGFSGSEGGKTTIKAPIIYPQEATGLRNGVRVVSFMMSAEKLLRTSYVLRKDSWEESMFLYQRLIEKDKVKSIRAFLAQKGEAFYNNIIVALPDNVTFEDDAGTPILVENIGDFQHCKLVLPDEMNSICIIDGQHRIFAHYEAPATEKYELQIAPLRRQLHLLVTGLIFPTEMKEPERKQIQSQIFLDINDNTKKVAPNVLTHKKSAIIMLLSLLAEGVSLWLLDRYTVKHHIAFLQNRQSHLKETEVFLKKTIPDVNLFQEELIDELIKRLSDRIDQRVPFKNFLKGIESFAKAIILPIITYVAGVYSAGLEEISIDVVATYAVFIIMLLGIVRLSWVGFSDIAKTFFCRDYNAAIAFREDLLDLRLLYFRIDKDANKND